MIVMLISFVLDGVFSNILKAPFLPLFSIVSLVVMENYKKSEKNYLINCSILGLLYDLVYTNTLFLNSLYFLLIGFIIMFCFHFLTHRLDIELLGTTLSILLFRTFSFITYKMFYNIPSHLLLPSIYNSIIVNLIYCILIHLLVKKIKLHK